MREPVQNAKIDTLWMDVDGNNAMVVTATVYPGGRLAGFLEFKAPLGRGPHQSWKVKPPGIASFRRLFVHPEWRRQGLATQMVAVLERICEQNGCPYLGLLVQVDNTDAQAFYQSIGFQFAPEHHVSIRGQVSDFGMVKFIVPLRGIGRPVDGE